MTALRELLHATNLPLYLRVFTENSSVVGTGALVAAGGLALAAVLPRRRVLVALTGLALAVVVAVTVVPDGGWNRLGTAGRGLNAALVVLHPTPADLTRWVTAADGPANVVLYVPFGLCLALLLRQLVPAVGLAALLSATIECYQAGMTNRVGCCADVIANSLGAAAGVLLAAVLLAAEGLLTVVARRTLRQAPRR